MILNKIGQMSLVHNHLLKQDNFKKYKNNLTEGTT